jgi:minor extracellular protease Epr
MQKKWMFGVSAFAVFTLTDVPLLSPGSPWHDFGISQALADDDDGGGGDDDGGGGGGGGSFGGNQDGGSTFDEPRKFKKAKLQKRKVVRKQKRKTAKAEKRNISKKPAAPKLSALPVAAPDQLVLRNASEADLKALLAKDFTLLARTRGLKNEWTAKLRIPNKKSLRRARDEARKIAPDASIEFNHYYRNGYQTQSGGKCLGEQCRPFELVKWTSTIQTCRILPEVGIIDTPIDRSHAALKGATIVGLNAAQPEDTAIDSSHGTAVATLLAGTIGGLSPGLVPRVRLKSMNVFEVGSSNDLRTDAYLLADAIETMARENVWVVNMSVAGPENDVLLDAVKQYSESGGLIVAAAGNFGPSAPPAYPAAYENVIAVAAVGENLELYKRSNRGEHIDLTAPGVNIRSAGQDGTISNFTGTSFAAPFVTAAAAVLLSNGKSVTDVAAQLKSSARDLGKPGPDTKFGSGLIQFIENCDTSP